MLLRNQRGMRRGFVLAGLGVILSLLFSPLIQGALAASGSDDFNRANSTNLGWQWTERAGDFQIYSNTLRNADTSADIVASFTGGPYTDVVAMVQMQKTANTGTTTIGVRWGGYSGGVPLQGYGAEVLGDGTVTLWRIDDWTVLSSYQIPSFQYNQWVTITLRAEGSTLGVDVNGVRRITETDATYSSGDVGVWSYSASSANQHLFDNFVLTDLAGPTATPTETATATFSYAIAVV